VCGSFGIKGCKNSLKLFVPCHHPALCALLPQRALTRTGSTVTSESTPCSTHLEPVLYSW
jgi:hypothetical protein